MKLIIAILHAKDADACVTALNDAGFACTRLGSFGGFLERDNVTLLIGVEAAQVESLLPSNRDIQCAYSCTAR